MGSVCCRSSFFLHSAPLNDRALLLKNHSPGLALQSWRVDPSAVHHPLSCAPGWCQKRYRPDQATVSSNPGFDSGVRQIARQVRQRLVAFDRGQRHFRLFRFIFFSCGGSNYLRIVTYAVVSDPGSTSECHLC